MAKKKDFTKTSPDSYVTGGEESLAFQSNGAVPVKPVAWATNPESINMKVNFNKNALSLRTFDFALWYGVGIDAVTRSCHQAISIMLGEKNRQHSTIGSYCNGGIRLFLPFCQTWSAALQRPMKLKDIDKSLIESYLSFLSDTGMSEGSQKTIYSSLKSVLVKIGKLGWINVSGLFPKNPFPKSNRKYKGQKSLSNKERQRVIQQLKTDLNNVLEGEDPLDSYELGICILAIAARSGMNPQPLLELPVDCIQLHPLKANRRLLVSYKRRGNSTHIQALRKSENLELVKTVMPDVEAIIEIVIKRNAAIRSHTGGNSGRLFIFISNKSKEQISEVSSSTFRYNCNKWIERHELKDDSGNRLKLNIMRLRKTFENRIWLLSGQDPWVTAKMGGHSLIVSNDYYLEAPKEAEKNFRFMGEALTQELLGNPEVSTLPSEKTPVSKCKDSLNGPFTPRAKGEHCTNFLACVRCRSFVVTEEDLYRLFSFYWLLVSERSQIGARKWKKYFAHIIRIIERDIVPRFDANVIETAKAEAKEQPHPFWRNRDQLEAAE